MSHEFRAPIRPIRGSNAQGLSLCADFAPSSSLFVLFFSYAYKCPLSQLLSFDIFTNARGRGAYFAVFSSIFDPPKSNSCICHTSENRAHKSFVCHTSKFIGLKVLCLPHFREKAGVGDKLLTRNRQNEGDCHLKALSWHSGTARHSKILGGDSELTTKN
jgi:hypothetical protein